MPRLRASYSPYPEYNESYRSMVYRMTTSIHHALLLSLPLETLRAASLPATELVAACSTARFGTASLRKVTFGNPFLCKNDNLSTPYTTSRELECHTLVASRASRLDGPDGFADYFRARFPDLLALGEVTEVNSVRDAGQNAEGHEVRRDAVRSWR